jgi:GTP-binding protein
LNIDASFVRSAVGASDLPGDGLAELALVGRSNVGKSSLINALVRQRLARTSAAPGKTRLANVYRVARAPRRDRGALSESKGGGDASFYLLDLPGYGYAQAPRGSRGTVSPDAARRASQAEFEAIVRAVFERAPAALLLVDSRHPGLESDGAAWEWIRTMAAQSAVVATKIDKLGRGERIRALRTFESVLATSVLPVSAVTGEGLDELWILIDRLLSSNLPRSRPPRPKATAPPPHRKN